LLLLLLLLLFVVVVVGLVYNSNGPFQVCRIRVGADDERIQHETTALVDVCRYVVAYPLASIPATIHMAVIVLIHHLQHVFNSCLYGVCGIAVSLRGNLLLLCILLRIPAGCYALSQPLLFDHRVLVSVDLHSGMR
jgi:hypothetical protein